MNVLLLDLSFILLTVFEDEEDWEPLLLPVLFALLLAALPFCCLPIERGDVS